MPKQFDFEEAKNSHTIETVNWLKEVHEKPLTEDEFVEGYQALPHNHTHPSQHKNNPNVARKQYHRLKKNFGFFGGE